MSSLLDNSISLGADQTAGNGSLLNEASFYDPDPSNWFKSLPYAFKARIQDKSYTFYLPINPQNLTIVTHYATNVISTLYATVEEHSEQRYFDISIAGTTGFAPRYISAVAAPNAKTPTGRKAGRSGYADGSIFGGAAGGFFAKTLGKLDQAANKASDALNAALGQSRPYQAGVFFDSSGYIAFHNLYRFFLDYKKSAATTAPNKKDLAGDPTAANLSVSTTTKTSPLYFLNFKDNNQYSCSIQRFTLERSVDNPMLYNYNIQLRAYNITPISATIPFNQQRRLTELGLTTKPSILSRFKLTVRNAKSAVNSVGSALTTLGG